MKSFQDIWEKDARWLAGPQILTSAVESLRGKSLTAERDGDKLVIRLPFKEVLGKNDVPTYALFFMVPEQLQDILEEQLQSVMDLYRPAVVSLLAPYEGQIMSPGLIAQINLLLVDHEQKSHDARNLTLGDTVAMVFGLPHLCHARPVEVTKEQLKIMREQHAHERDCEAKYSAAPHGYHSAR